MSTKKYNVGIIGYGWAATAHIDAINKTAYAQVTAIYSSRPLDSAALSAKHGGKIKAYQTVEALLADPTPSKGLRPVKDCLALADQFGFGEF